MAQAKAAQKKEPKPAAMPKPVHGTFIWNELMTHDVEAAKKFYASVLGWTFQPFSQDEPNNYWMIKAGGKVSGGIFEMKSPELAKVPDHWVTYVAVDDVDACVAKVLAAGGKVCHGPMDIPKVGRIVLLFDKGGAQFALITPKM